jgi:p21-activated kinase 1
MSSTQSAINQRSFNNQQRRQSKITVEYHRPSRESIQEYNALLAESNLHAAEAAKYSSFAPTRQAPSPPQSSSVRSKTPTDSSLPTLNPPPRIRNSLQKPNPRARKHSLTSASFTARIPEHDPFAAHATASDSSLVQGLNRPNGMASSTSPPPRPSRANTATLNDIFPPSSALAARRLSSPAGPINDDVQFHADPSEALPSGTSHEYINGSSTTLIHTPTLGNRARSATTTKAKKGVLGFMSVFNPTKRPEISTPYDPVHLTHVGFNSSTGEFTGLPKEWQQLLQESGISRSDQEKNPQAVMEIVKFYQEGRGDVWDKLGAMGPADPSDVSPSIDDTLQNPVSNEPDIKLRPYICNNSDPLHHHQSPSHSTHKVQQLPSLHPRLTGLHRRPQMSSLPP